MVKKNVVKLPSYDEVPLNPDQYYTIAPYDETNSKYKKYDSEIGLPENDIIVFGPEYLTTRHTHFSLRQGFSKYTSHTLLIYDNENNEVFNCKIKNNYTIVLYNKHKNALMTSFVDPSNYYKSIYILKGKKKKGHIIATLKSKSGIFDSTKIYNVNFLNQNTGTQEELIIKVSNYKYFEIFCNEEGENETKICKITSKRNEYTIEVAPRVDYLFMISVCNAFSLRKPVAYI
ncbi:hypothetical protein H8356DRAFT_1740638 [Neocallimastix lanati (nom. inval.)]|jgi:hypothetical protein|nr:hypothetical protein H8356DRAFT_1740638 [Neocallimastix sp. JGI-2020a]